MSVPRVKVLATETRFVLKFAFNPALIEWAKDELISSTFVPGEDVRDFFGNVVEKRKGYWQIDRTPAAAWTFLRTCPLNAHGPGLPALRELAEQYVDDVQLAEHLVGVDLDQPPIRRFDSWAHQLRAYWFAEQQNDVCLLGMGMGTGKSKVLVDRAVNSSCRVVLILCPNSVLGVWRREIARHAPQADALILDDDTPRVRKGLKSKTEIKVEAAKKAYELRLRQTTPGPPLFIVNNYESAREKGFSNWATRVFWDMVGLDESHRVKSPSGVTSKFVDKLRVVARRRLCLTGTPMAHSPGDLFSQFRFLDLGVFGPSYFVFKKRYAIEGHFGEVVGYRKKDELQRQFHARSIVVDSSVLDLPPYVMTERSFKLPKRALAIYREFWRELVVSIEAGVCSADNALVKLTRAAQIASGYLVLDDESDPFDENASLRKEYEVVHDEKTKALRELLEDYSDPEPVVVFCRFRYDLDRVREVCEALDLECGEISGRQKDLTPNAELQDGFDVFAVQVQSGGVGVDFTKASVGVLYSIDWSLGNFEQMLARLVRPGQKKSVRFVKLIAEGTVDRLVYQRLAERRDVVAEIMRAVAARDLESVLSLESGAGDLAGIVEND